MIVDLCRKNDQTFIDNMLLLTLKALNICQRFSLVIAVSYLISSLDCSLLKGSEVWTFLYINTCGF